MSLLCTVFPTRSNAARSLDKLPGFTHICWGICLCVRMFIELCLRQGLILAMCTWGPLDIGCSTKPARAKVMDSTDYKSTRTLQTSGLKSSHHRRPRRPRPGCYCITCASTSQVCFGYISISRMCLRWRRKNNSTLIS